MQITHHPTGGGSGGDYRISRVHLQKESKGLETGTPAGEAAKKEASFLEAEKGSFLEAEKGSSLKTPVASDGASPRGVSNGVGAGRGGAGGEE